MAVDDDDDAEEKLAVIFDEKETLYTRAAVAFQLFWCRRRRRPLELLLPTNRIMVVGWFGST